MTEAIKAISEISPSLKTLVILEDVDDMDDGQVSDAMDGIVKSSNIVYLATTNYIDEVSDRLKNRPSRFDEVIEIAYPGEAARKAYLDMICKNPSIVEELMPLSSEMSVAHVKELAIQKIIYNNPDIKSLADKFREDCKNTSTKKGNDES